MARNWATWLSRLEAGSQEVGVPQEVGAPEGRLTWEEREAPGLSWPLRSS